MATEGLPDGVDVVVGDAELLARLADYGGDEWVMCLDDSGEEVVGGLVVQSSGEDVPEPTVSGVILRRAHLHLRPLRVCVCGRREEGGGRREEGGWVLFCPQGQLTSPGGPYCLLGQVSATQPAVSVYILPQSPQHCWVSL